MLITGDMAKTADMVYNMTTSTVHDVLRQAVPSMFFSVTVGYVTLAVLLVSYFPLRRWTQNALQKIKKQKSLCAKSDAFKFFSTSL